MRGAAKRGCRAMPVAVALVTTLAVGSPIRNALGQEGGDPSLRKWVGTWKEPYALVGTRRIIEISEKDGKLAARFSDPAVPNGVFNIRMWFSLKDITVVDDTTLTWKEGSLKVTATFIPGADGSPATMETSKDVAGTIGAWFGQTKPHVARLKKE